MITRALNAIFEKEHTLSLDRLRTLSKRDARQFLRDLPEMHPFVEAYVMLFAFDGHTRPGRRARSSRYLRDQNVVDETTTADEAQRFLEHHLKAEECYDFYALARRSSTHADPTAEAKKKKAKA